MTSLSIFIGIGGFPKNTRRAEKPRNRSAKKPPAKIFFFKPEAYVFYLAFENFKVVFTVGYYTLRRHFGQFT